MRSLADLMGADAYPGSEPQAQEDMKLRYPDSSQLSDLQLSLEEPTTKEYRWVYANGQLHVSPIHSHDELRDHSGVGEDHAGPFAAGYVSLLGRNATWSAESNVALRGLSKVLEDYSETVGWEWGGLNGGDGLPIHDDLGAKKSMWYRRKAKDGQIDLSMAHFAGARLITIRGSTAWVDKKIPALEEWAHDFSYRLAEYPGGTQMVDRIKNKERLDGRDKGNPEAEPEGFMEMEPGGPLDCPVCGEQLPDFKAYQLHTRGHEDLSMQPIDDGHFPQVDQLDDPLPLRQQQSQPTAMPLASFKEASEVSNFHLYSRIWSFGDDDQKVFYGGFYKGSLKGYAVVREGPDPEILMIYSSEPGKGIGTALISKIAQQYPRFYTHANTKEGQRLLEKIGAVNIEGQLYRYGAGEEPKDLVQAPIPFVYDIVKDHITTGHPGMRSTDIMGQFTPQGTVEGYYEPGGKFVLTGPAPVPFSTYHLQQLWYHNHPTMEITGVEIENGKGETQKIAGASVGSYLKTLAITDPAAWNSYQALRQAGGKVYIVGGAVRDALLQKEPKDLDMLVAGLPPETVNHILSELPGQVDLTGRRFGVYRYRTKGSEVEIALPRTDSYENADRRAQGKITVDHTLPVDQDLNRRDFTANSMAVDLDTGELIDPYGGAKDIDARVLRSTHPASFEEDPTRLIRALVASSRHGLLPDEKTRSEMAVNASRLDRESPDALKQQLDKLLESPNPAGAIRLAQETGVLNHLFPEIGHNFDYDQKNRHHNFTLGDHSLNVLDHIARNSQDKGLRLAALLHDIGKPASAWWDPIAEVNHYYPTQIDGRIVGADHAAVGADMAESRLRSGFNYPVADTARIRTLIEQHMFPRFTSPRGARKFLAKAGEHADDLLTLREADQSGKGVGSEEDAAKEETAHMRSLVDQARVQGNATNVGSLAINGNDIVSMGVKPGPVIGQILNGLLEQVIADPQLNNPADLGRLTQEYLQNEQAGLG